MGLKIDFAATTADGKLKNTGTDAVLAEPDLGLFALATGQPKGAEPGAPSSAQIFLDTLRTHVDEITAALAAQKGAWGQLGKVFGLVFHQASQAIHAEFGGRVPDTSATILMIHGGRGAVTHVGRTRAYAIRGGEVARLTEEHVDKEDTAEQGEMTHLAVKATGVGAQSLGQEKALEVGGVLFKLKPDTRIVLISQGIAGIVRGERLSGLSRGQPELEDYAAAIVRAASERQMIADNTALVVGISDDAEAATRPDHSATLASEAPTMSDAVAEAPAPPPPAEKPLPLSTPRSPAAAESLAALFDGMSPEQQDKLQRAGSEVTMAAREFLFRKGETAKRCYVVQTGMLEAVGAQGVAAAFGPGDLVGEQAFARNGERLAHVTATGKVSLLGFRVDRLEALFQSDPELAAHFYRNALRMLIRP